MSEIGKRFLEVRTFFGKSQREMASDFGLGRTGWTAYESGSAIPKLDVLLALQSRGIDLNWLIGGKGQMHLARSGELPSQPGFVRDAEASVFSRLHLGRMSLAAARGTVLLRARGLELISLSGAEGISLSELEAQLGTAFGTEMLQLIDEGVVKLRTLENGVERYSVAGQLTVTRTNSNDREQAAIDALEFLASEVIPATKAVPSTGICLRLTIHTVNGKEFIRRVVSFLQEEVGPVPTGQTETVELIFGACLDRSRRSRK